LKLLDRRGYTLNGILSEKSASPISGFQGVAKRLGYDLLPAHLVTKSAFAQWVKAQQIDVLLNVHSLYVICPEVLQEVQIGAYNLHPGHLPECAGLNAPSWAIYGMQTHHTVCLHEMNQGIDTGRMVEEITFEVSPQETGRSLSLKCTRRGLALIKRLLDSIEQGYILNSGREQDLSQRVFYTKNQVPNQGEVVWHETALKVDALVRACNYFPFESPWGVPYSRIDENIRIDIIKTRPTRQPVSGLPGILKLKDGKIFISASDYWIQLIKYQVNGQQPDAAVKAGLDGLQCDMAW